MAWRGACEKDRARLRKRPSELTANERVRGSLAGCACSTSAEPGLSHGHPYCRFYCGMPLITDEGYALGTLCVMDVEPGRELSFEQIESMRRLSRQVLTQLE